MPLRIPNCIATATSRRVASGNERLERPHLILEDSRSGQKRQLSFTPTFGSSRTPCSDECQRVLTPLSSPRYLVQAAQGWGNQPTPVRTSRSFDVNSASVITNN